VVASVVASVVGGGSVVVGTVVGGASVVVGAAVVRVVVRGGVVRVVVRGRGITGWLVAGARLTVRIAGVVRTAVVRTAADDVVGGGGARFGVSGMSNPAVAVGLGVASSVGPVAGEPAVTVPPGAAPSCWVALAACGGTDPPSNPTISRYPRRGRLTSARPTADPRATRSGHPGRVPRCVPT
jgi:hypothetical protein